MCVVFVCKATSFTNNAIQMKTVLWFWWLEEPLNFFHVHSFHFLYTNQASASKLGTITICVFGFLIMKFMFTYVQAN